MDQSGPGLDWVRILGSESVDGPNLGSWTEDLAEPGSDLTCVVTCDRVSDRLRLVSKGFRSSTDLCLSYYVGLSSRSTVISIIQGNIFTS